MSTETVSTAEADAPQTTAARRLLMVASDPSVSGQTGWEIGFWWEELTHSYWEFTNAGYEVVIASPNGGALMGDPLSDPRDDRRLEANDLISLGFINSPEHAGLLNDVPSISTLDVSDFDAVFLVGGEGPMYTFVDNPLVQGLVRAFYEAGKIDDTNFIVQGPYAEHAVRDGNLITGQQQSSAAVTARLVIEALGK